MSDYAATSLKYKADTDNFAPNVGANSFLGVIEV